ncbi:MAG: DUF2914 domain-containing protein [Deltaproteobacteria bacterium]|nr:DUF2914 domain-containing protein [Deltaproteobacteria bacterium]MBW2083715.1 DUF2914 domain-containing protein [Deltaproteobacteria bacterium]HDM09441.1 DUF2914 domain-containing protein [Desulfobacteraceae bacterium]
MAAMAAGPSSLQVTEAYICLDVVDLQCQGKDTTFSSSLGKLYCFTRVIGAQEPTQIFHVWYYGQNERARVPLQVNSSNWRTYSSKIIQAHEAGQWRVEILGPNNELLNVVRFQVVP